MQEVVYKCQEKNTEPVQGRVSDVKRKVVW